MENKGGQPTKEDVEAAYALVELSAGNEEVTNHELRTRSEGELEAAETLSELTSLHLIATLDPSPFFSSAEWSVDELMAYFGDFATADDSPEEKIAHNVSSADPRGPFFPFFRFFFEKLEDEDMFIVSRLLEVYGLTVVSDAFTMVTTAEPSVSDKRHILMRMEASLKVFMGGRS